MHPLKKQEWGELFPLPGLRIAFKRQEKILEGLLFGAWHPETRLAQRTVAVCGYHLIDVAGNAAD